MCDLHIIEQGVRPREKTERNSVLMLGSPASNDLQTLF